MGWGSLFNDIMSLSKEAGLFICHQRAVIFVKIGFLRQELAKRILRLFDWGNMRGQKVNKFLLQDVKFKVEHKHAIQELKAPGVYCIVNRINDHRYVGQSMCISDRKKQHLQALRKGNHVNPYLQNAWSFYGEQSFIFVVLEYCKVCDLDEREQHWIDELKPVYNIVKDIYAWHYYRSGTDMPDGYIKQGETFTRPLWHLWVYGGQKSLKS